MQCTACGANQVLNKCYSACDLELYEGNYNLSVKGWERSTHVSLRAASKESTPWSAFKKNKCKCTVGCSTQGGLVRGIKLNAPHTVIKGIIAKTRIVHLHLQ